MLPRALLVLLTAAGVFAGVTADAASMSMNVRSLAVTNTNALAGRPAGNGYGPRTPPPITRSLANDSYDTSTNLNPGGGGGSVKPGHKPNPQ